MRYNLWLRLRILLEHVALVTLGSLRKYLQHAGPQDGPLPLHVIALQPFSALLRLEGFTSCQAKLLLGHGCLAPVTLRESDILRAEEILR